jgi:hypothetical protein
MPSLAPDDVHMLCRFPSEWTVSRVVDRRHGAQRGTTVDELYERTVAARERPPFELLFVDDGSTTTRSQRSRGCTTPTRACTRSASRATSASTPRCTPASRARAATILVTMDGDLQNQPEDIPKLVAALEARTSRRRRGGDARRDSGAHAPVAHHQRMLRRFTGVPISTSAARSTRTAAASSRCSARSAGRSSRRRSCSRRRVGRRGRRRARAARRASRYSPLRLTRLALHVLAGFWPQPIQWIGVTLGVVCALAATALGIYGVVFWITESNFPGPLFGGRRIVFVLGVQGFILALIGEYLGRIQREVEGSRCTRSRGALSKTVLVTGGPGSSRRTSSATCWRRPPYDVVSLDALTYAGQPREPRRT